MLIFALTYLSAAAILGVFLAQAFAGHDGPEAGPEWDKTNLR